MMPDCRPAGIRDRLAVKCRVLYYPVEFADVTEFNHRNCSPNVRIADCGSALDTSSCDAAISTGTEFVNSSSIDDGSSGDVCNDAVRMPASVLPCSEPLHIVWPHRWYVTLMTTYTALSHNYYS